MIFQLRRNLLAGLSLALGLAQAPPALPQTPSLNQLTAQQNDLWAQQQAADQRAIAQRNELEALDAKLQTETRLQQMRTQGLGLRIPDPVYSPGLAPAPGGVASLAVDYPSIPDKDLAASRARVLSASRNRR